MKDIEERYTMTNHFSMGDCTYTSEYVYDESKPLVTVREFIEYIMASDNFGDIEVMGTSNRYRFDHGRLYRYKGESRLDYEDYPTHLDEIIIDPNEGIDVVTKAKSNGGWGQMNWELTVVTKKDLTKGFAKKQREVVKVVAFDRERFIPNEDNSITLVEKLSCERVKAIDDYIIKQLYETYKKTDISKLFIIDETEFARYIEATLPQYLKTKGE